MNEKQLDTLEKILLFYPYLKKNTVSEQLNECNKFPNFNSTYVSIRKENKDDSTADIIAKTLVHGIKEKIIDELDLDDLLFALLEDSLLNSYLFKLNTSAFNLDDVNFSKQLLKSWGIPQQHKILSNINNLSVDKDFVICGYRELNDGKLDTLRILLLDSKIVSTKFKNGDSKQIIFPTIVDIDFRRELLHIRLRDVDNIVSESSELSTMSGRVENTLNFLDHFKPAINYSRVENFRNNLFSLEEALLSNKRKKAYEKLEILDTEIEKFTNIVCEEFTPPDNTDITPKDYISNGVLSIIATTLDVSDLGDVVGIRFRNAKSDRDLNYAEIKITDNGDKCISSNNLYWLNLPVLLNRRAIEYLKIIKRLESGTAIVNLEFSLNTANIRILHKNKSEEIENKQPTQEKYDDFINFIMPFIK
ncbi:hypothetical protein COJ37_11925 [Bacillus cereus]|uniref:hypothetical protein n=1 Tax=Bacillus cereus group TaxID=86661 RepID=UPI000BF55975|nr:MULTISPECIES: hypothetical protein [Bacillus cereus group]PFF54086.1 hypothetical protein CN334_29010 [Bacillus thuringiensis]PFM01305.1 hypothetical protein COJ37_11925 [Bacillus cereus]PGL88416.1 hypothetical protein CN943_32120 [Bacillus thuringiensis]